MKHLLQDHHIEQIIRDGKTPDHEEFRAQLFERLSGQVHSSKQPTPMIKKLFSFWTLTPLAAVGIAVLAFFVVTGQHGITDTITKKLTPKELLAASIERSFGDTDVNTFRYQEFILADKHNVSKHNRWVYRGFTRSDFYTLVKERSLNYQSSLSTQDYVCTLSIYQGTPSSEFVTNGPQSCRDGASVSQEDPSNSEAYLNALQASIATLGEPTVTSDETYQGYAAVRSTYNLPQGQAHLPYLNNSSAKTISVAFVILVDQKQIVSVTYTDSKTDEALMQFIVAQDYAITDVDPEQFFTQDAWEDAMADAQDLASAFANGSSAYALPKLESGTTEIKNGTTIFTSSAYPISVSVPTSGWEIDAETNEYDTAVVAKIVHPDPKEGIREGEMGFPQQALVTVHAWKRGDDGFERLDALLNQTTERTYEESQMEPVEQETDEEAVTLNGLSGKRYNVTSTSEFNTVVSVETVLRLDADTILQLAGTVYSDDAQIQDEILAIQDSIRRVTE